MEAQKNECCCTYVNPAQTVRQENSPNWEIVLCGCSRCHPGVAWRGVARQWGVPHHPQATGRWYAERRQVVRHKTHLRSMLCAVSVGSPLSIAHCPCLARPGNRWNLRTPPLVLRSSSRQAAPSQKQRRRRPTADGRCSVQCSE